MQTIMDDSKTRVSSLNDKPKYFIGEIVDVHSWTRETRVTILDIKPVYHMRMYQWVWGYKVDKEVGLTYIYVPEGYLRKIV